MAAKLCNAIIRGTLSVKLAAATDFLSPSDRYLSSTTFIQLYTTSFSKSPDKCPYGFRYTTHQSCYALR